MTMGSDVFLLSLFRWSAEQVEKKDEKQSDKKITYHYAARMNQVITELIFSKELTSYGRR